LWKHSKKCITSDADYDVVEYVDKKTYCDPSPHVPIDIITTLMDRNKELQNMLSSAIHTIKTPTITTNKFNLQFFLNETCKNAMNIRDFINSIKLQIADLETVGNNGYVSGITNIIMSNLNILDKARRPLHCVDSKRDIIYVKDKNIWTKETSNKEHIKHMIKCVSQKNLELIPKWREGHPDYLVADSVVSDKYQNIIIESMGGSVSIDSNATIETKIIKSLSRNTIEVE